MGLASDFSLLQDPEPNGRGREKIRAEPCRSLTAPSKAGVPGLEGAMKFHLKETAWQGFQDFLESWERHRREIRLSDSAQGSTEMLGAVAGPAFESAEEGIGVLETEEKRDLDR